MTYNGTGSATATCTVSASTEFGTVTLSPSQNVSFTSYSGNVVNESGSFYDNNGRLYNVSGVSVACVPATRTFSSW